MDAVLSLFSLHVVYILCLGYITDCYSTRYETLKLHILLWYFNNVKFADSLSNYLNIESFI